MAGPGGEVKVAHRARGRGRLASTPQPPVGTPASPVPASRWNMTLVEAAVRASRYSRAQDDRTGRQRHVGVDERPLEGESGRSGSAWTMAMDARRLRRAPYSRERAGVLVHRPGRRRPRAGHACGRGSTRKEHTAVRREHDDRRVQPVLHIPVSIASTETAPAIVKDPSYLTKMNIEVLRASKTGMSPSIRKRSIGRTRPPCASRSVSVRVPRTRSDTSSSSAEHIRCLPATHPPPPCSRGKAARKPLRPSRRAGRSPATCCARP